MFVTFKEEKVANELVFKGELIVEEVIFTAVFHSPENNSPDDDKFTESDVECLGSDVDSTDNDIREHDEDSSFPYEHFIETLGLTDYYPNKINISCVMTIDIENGSMFDQDQAKIELTELPWILLRSLLGVYCKARDRVASLIKERSGSQEQFTSDWLFAESYDDTEINPLDLFITVYKCCDPMLKQLLFQKCYSCKIAVPFIHVLHDFSSLSSRSVVSIWPLRCLFIQNRYVNNEAKTTLSVEEGVYEHPTNLITFARIGKSTNSKSEILNCLLSDNNCKTFFDKNCAPQMTNHKYSEGLVEIFWLPVAGNSMDMFNNPVTFLNCRGSLHQFQQKVLDFVSYLTDIFVVLLDIETLHDTSKWCTDDFVSKFSSMIIIIDNPMIRRNEPIMNTFRSKIQSQGKICELISTYQGKRKLNPIEMTGILQRQLQNLLIKIQPSSLNTRIKCCSLNIDFDEDNDSCKEGKKRAEFIIQEMARAGNILEWRTAITPVQTTISNRIAPLIKQQQRLQYETEIKEIGEKLLSLRRSCLDNVTSTVQHFALYLCNTCDLSLQFFLGWLNIMLGNMRMSKVYNLQKECNVKIASLKLNDCTSINVQQEIDQVLKATEDEIEKSSFSIEHLFREISHIYDVLLILKIDSCLPPVEKVKATVAELIYIGYAFELVDGDSFFLPTHWVAEMLQSLSLKIDHKSVLTLSVLGLQSSGKSTLLNTMFGSHFAASSGRCTKGLNLQLIPMSQRNNKRCNFRYVLVVDTEGLRATELYDYNLIHDNELATFVTGLGDVTILNVMGENICEINDILNVTVHAFIRLQKANKSLDIRKSCYFVHQNVSGILTAHKTKPGLRKLVQKLNDATKDAAQLENVSNISEFNEIIKFDMDSQVFYMPSLWQGISPMSFVNSEYSQHVNHVKNMIFKGACAKENKSYKSLKDLVTHMENLWTGVLSEDFVFSFRNNIEIKAYIHLNEYFKRKHYIIESQIYEKCCVSAKKTFSKSIDIKQLDYDFDQAKYITDKAIDNEEEKWKLDMDDFFRKSSYSEQQVHWKGMTLTRIATTCLDLRCNVKLEISTLHDDRAVEILTTMDKTHEDDLIKRSWNLAKELKGNFSDEIINSKFEKIWTDIASQSLRSFGESTSIDIKKIIHIYLNNLFDQNKPLLKKFLDSRDENIVTVKLHGSFKQLCIDKSDLHRNKSVWGHLGMRRSKKNKMEFIETNTESLFGMIDIIIMRQLKSKNKITGSGVKCFFEEVEDFYSSFDKRLTEEFSYDIKLKIKIFIQIAECARNMFERHNVNYDKYFGPEARRQQYKQKMKNIFMSFLHERQVDETVACEFSNSVKSSVQNTVIQLLTRNIKTVLCSHIGSLKYYFITNLLSDLILKNDYTLFSKYNHNPKLFAAQWITKRCNTILFCEPSKKYFSMACSYIVEYFEDVKGSVIKTAESVEISSASDDWIDTLSSNLEKCTISASQLNLLKNLLRRKVDLQNLKEPLIRKLDEAENELKKHFQKIDSTTVTWNISERLDPITEVIKDTWGCPEECPFCGEPCARDIHDAEKLPHFCIQHKPKGCKAVYSTGSKQLSITTCNFSVSSKDLTHTCCVFDYACKPGTEKKSCPLEKHRYRDYKKFIKNWDIEPNTDIGAVCKFWMLYLSRFAKDITKDTDIEISDIPASWQNISNEDAIESLRKLYN